MNLRYKFANPRNCWRLFQSPGWGHCSTARTFSGSMAMLPVEVIYPRKVVEVQEKTHFSAFTNRRFSRRRWRTLLT